MTATERRPRRDQQRNREALLSAARESFASQGIGAPLDVIARRAGLGNATLYRHFPTRRALVVEILRMNLQRSSAVLAVALRRPAGWDGLVDYLSWLFAEQIDNAAYMSALRAVPSGQDEEVDAVRDQTFADLNQLIGRAKAEGAMRADRWIEDILLALTLNETLATTGHRDARSASQRFLELTLAALATESAAAESPDEPAAVLALRGTLGTELAGLPAPE
ncbi:TetR/AcrR family transcriptional regulator [Occultella gossypii]|uniref:TetR/AcrR family transcriptional regulator n=1 Tax=Occultella gossypii TaxID=2800820 RepID=A0ABS7SE91_9MICO|nr:TetR/AcrR family transcriptional regulator [Occultella gossypii]MBZ2198664.1 TetR/AcrR family transcriptional regulator [Occultella gossypii]